MSDDIEDEEMMEIRRNEREVHLEEEKKENEEN